VTPTAGSQLGPDAQAAIVHLRNECPRGRVPVEVVADACERFGDQLLRVPGFLVKQGRSGCYLTFRGPAGQIVPCRHRAGRIVALKVRRDDAGEGGPR
jgi:hypothetical protein